MHNATISLAKMLKRNNEVLIEIRPLLHSSAMQSTCHAVYLDPRHVGGAALITYGLFHSLGARGFGSSPLWAVGLYYRSPGAVGTVFADKLRSNIFHHVNQKNLP